jgi:hypothetical protein
MAKPKCIPSKDYLHQIFEYKNGNLYWKIKPAQRVKIGDIAGSISDGYGQVYLNNSPYKIHRIIFMMHYECVPDQIDHIDGNPLNNKIENLREVTNTQNQFNRKISSRNTTGVKGVSLSKSNKFVVRISTNQKDKYFGSFDNLELAELVAQEAREKYHGEFARHF